MAGGGTLGSGVFLDWTNHWWLPHITVCADYAYFLAEGGGATSELVWWVHINGLVQTLGYDRAMKMQSVQWSSSHPSRWCVEGIWTERSVPCGVAGGGTLGSGVFLDWTNHWWLPHITGCADYAYFLAEGGGATSELVWWVHVNGLVQTLGYDRAMKMQSVQWSSSHPSRWCVEGIWTERSVPCGVAGGGTLGSGVFLDWDNHWWLPHITGCADYASFWLREAVPLVHACCETQLDWAASGKQPLAELNYLYWFKT